MNQKRRRGAPQRSCPEAAPREARREFETDPTMNPAFLHDPAHEARPSERRERPRRRLAVCVPWVLVLLTACAPLGCDSGRESPSGADASGTSDSSPAESGASSAVPGSPAAGAEGNRGPDSGGGASPAGASEAGTPGSGRSQDALAVLRTRPLYDMPEDWVAFEPLLAEIARESWPRSVVAQDELDETLATVNGVAITGLDLAKELILRFGLEPWRELFSDMVSLADTAGRGIDVSDAEIERGVGMILSTSRTPNADQYRRRFGKGPARLRLEAKAEAARRKAFAQDKGRDEFREKDGLEYVIWHPVQVDRYPAAPATEYGYDRLPEGAVAEVHGAAVPVELVLPYVLSFMKPVEREVALDGLIDATLVAQELERRGIRVDPVDVDRMIAERERMTAGGIAWRKLIESKGKFNPLTAETVGFVRRRLSLQLALDQIEGSPDEAEIVEYFNRHQPMIGRSSVKLQTIRFPLYRPNGEPLDAFEMAQVKIAVDRALDALRGGMAFNDAVREFSRDPKTRRVTEVFGKRVAGDIGATNIRDGVVDECIAMMGFFARPGEWVGPIRSPRWYDIVQPYWNRLPVAYPYEDESYTDMNENGVFDPGEPWVDFNGNGKRDFGRRRFALNEFLRDRSLAFTEDLREKAEIEILD